MADKQQIQQIVAELCDGLSAVFPSEKMEAIVFGSLARGDWEDGSDIDVLLLIDAPREVIARHNWQIGNIAADLLLDHGVLVSPIVENRTYFNANAEALPFYRNIRREGVRFSA